MLQEILLNKALPIKVQRTHWKENEWFEIRSTSEIWAIGKFDNGKKGKFLLNGLGWILYEEKPPRMKLYLLSQYENKGYDVYYSAVVVAENEDDARETHPSGTKGKWWKSKNGDYPNWKIDDWAKPKDVKVEYLGEARVEIDKDGKEIPMKAGVICADYNAG